MGTGAFFSDDASIRVSLCCENLLLLDVLTRTLTAPGCQVVAGTDRAELLLAGLAEVRPDVAVIAGWQDRASLRRWGDALPFHPQVRFLFVARAGPELHALALQAGAHGFLDATDANARAICDTVRALARGERPLPPQALRAGFEPRPRPRVPALSEREREVLAWLGTGADNLKIAANLGLAERTIKAHVSALYRKLPCHNRTELGLYCRQLGIAPPREA